MMKWRSPSRKACRRKVRLRGDRNSACNSKVLGFSDAARSKDQSQADQVTVPRQGLDWANKRAAGVARSRASANNTRIYFHYTGVGERRKRAAIKARIVPRTRRLAMNGKRRSG